MNFENYGDDNFFISASWNAMFDTLCSVPLHIPLLSATGAAQRPKWANTRNRLNLRKVFHGELDAGF